MNIARSAFRRIGIGTALATLATLLFGATSVEAQTLTDIVLSRISGDGNTINEGWNTRGNETSVSNLYLLNGDTFVNSGNSAATSIAVALNTPGTYTFNFAGENVNSNTAPQLAINFFFNGNASSPGISARGLDGGGFAPNGGTTNLPDFTPVAGSNSLSFNSNGFLITLTNYSYQTASGTDQVSSFNNAPNGLGDTIGTFTLSVAPATVPEVSSVLLVTLGGLLGGDAIRRKK